MLLQQLLHFLFATRVCRLCRQSLAPQHACHTAKSRLSLSTHVHCKPCTLLLLLPLLPLQRLADALNLLSAEFESEGATLDLAGLHILICCKTALDSLGTLCLHSDDSAEDWADFLGGVDVEYARDKRDAAAALRQLEGAVAAALGVRMLFTAAHYIMTHEYRMFLERLAAHAAQHGPVQPLSAASTTAAGNTSSSSSSGSSSSSSSNSKSLSDVPVYVGPPRQHQQYARSSDQQQQAVHELVGYIMVHMDDASADVYRTIQVRLG
jgi:hypothetical protein